MCGAKAGGHSKWSSGFHGEGGPGGCSQGIITFFQKQKTYLFIGGKGVEALPSTVGQKAGGYNGGGKVNGNAGSGGGATDLRLSLDPQKALESRIMVAGGGGGGNDNSNGGSGGGIFGEPGKGAHPGEGANQTSPGHQYYPGSLGYGGSLEDTPVIIDGGAGGGGYYGGARAFASKSDGNSSGGGGSGFISGMDGCIAVDAGPNSPSIHSSGLIFQNPSMNFELNHDAGFAEITVLVPPSMRVRSRSRALPNLLMCLSWAIK